MAVQALGYIAIGAANLDWSEFAKRQLGLQQVEGSDSCRAFRMDDRRQRKIADKETGRRALLRLGGCRFRCPRRALGKA